MQDTDFITYSDVSDPQWADVQQTSVYVNVNWSTVGSVVRAWLSPTLQETHIQNLLAEVLAGDYGPIRAYEPPAPPPPPTAEQNKQQAVSLLQQTDWTEIPSVSNPASKPYLTNSAQFVIYRDSLRQIAVYPTAGNLDWPTKPTEQWSE